MSALDKLATDIEVVDYRQTILAIVGDMVTDFLYYDRKDCETLPIDTIEETVAAGDIT